MLQPSGLYVNCISDLLVSIKLRATAALSVFPHRQHQNKKFTYQLPLQKEQLYAGLAGRLRCITHEKFMRAIKSMSGLSSLFCNSVLQLVHVINSYGQEAGRINAAAMQGRGSLLTARIKPLIKVQSGEAINGPWLMLRRVTLCFKNFLTLNQFWKISQASDGDAH